MRNYLILLLLFPLATFAQDAADQILTKAINYHDPDGKWSTLSATFNYTETRPDGPNKTAMMVLDNSKSYMKLNRNDEEIYEVSHEEAQVLKGDKGVDRALRLRNYYLYLWGLPMKLTDESTPTITVAPDEQIENIACYVLRVAYEEDTWYFYFDQRSGRMLKYKFYKDAEETKGEVITLEGEIVVQGIRIPQKRSWYTLPEMKYLGTDILSSSN